MLKTKSGKHIIADITDPSFYPGKKIHSSYQDPEFNGGTWFFWAEYYLSETFGGIVHAKIRGYPMIYSPGFLTAEKALEAAEEWEATKEERSKQDNQPIQWLTIGIPPIQ